MALNKFFQKGKIINNSIFNTINIIVNALIFFITTPIMIKYLGIEGYGIYSLIIALTNIFGAMNFGFANATVQKVSYFYTSKNLKMINYVLGTSIFIYLIIGILIGGALFLFSNVEFFYSFLRIPEIYYSEFRLSLKISSVGILFIFINSIFSCIPYALKRNDIQVRVMIVINLITNVLFVISLIYFQNILSLILIKNISIILSTSIFYFKSKKLIPSLKVTFTFQKKLFKDMASFGMYNMITQISDIVNSNFDKFIIASILGPKFVTIYTIPLNLGQLLHGTLGAIFNVIFPFTTEQYSKGRLDKVREIYIMFQNNTMLLAGFLLIPIFLHAEIILGIWLGESYNKTSATVLMIVIVGFLILSSNITFFYMSNGINKPKINAMFSIVVTIIKVILTVILLPILGLEGAAIAFLVSTLITPFFIIHFEKVIKINNLHAVKFGYIPILLGSFIIITSVEYVYKLVKIDTLIEAIISSVIINLLLLLFLIVIKYFKYNNFKDIRNFLLRY